MPIFIVPFNLGDEKTVPCKLQNLRFFAPLKLDISYHGREK